MALCHAAARRAVCARSSGLKADHRAALHRGRVLIGDDDPARCVRLRQELEAEAFQVATAAAAADCAELAASWEPAVVILALGSGELDAVAICQRLKRDPQTAIIPILFLTDEETPNTTIVEALAAGGNDCLCDPYSTAEMRARVSSQIAIYVAHERLRRMAMTDELTGLASRRYLFESMPQHLERFGQDGTSALACLMIDVDFFKRVNDRLGHMEGDRVLRGVARIIRRSTRESDVVARFGGEEIAVVLPGTSGEEAFVVAEKVRASVETQSRDRGYPVTVSIGVAWIDDAAPLQTRYLSWDLLIDGLFRRADEALYRAKGDGRNRVCRQAWGRPTPLPTPADSPLPTVRRRHRRLAVPVTVSVTGTHGTVVRRTTDLSRGGMSIPDAYGLSEGARVVLRMALGDSDVEVVGVVVWGGDEPDESVRCGVAFETFHGDGEEVLDTFIANVVEGSRVA
jgi:diguanylate cyclase (GGDEF)-like protein